MSQIGRFDTDSAALRARIDAHQRYSSGDMTGWALELLGAGPGDRVLDVGAGTGEQTRRLAPAVRSVLAVDASAESLATLAADAPANVRTLAGRFDDLAAAPCDARFERAISCYALYYVEDAERAVARLHELLEPGGVLFFCGPAYENNAELRRLHWSLAEAEAPGPTPAATFMEQTGPALCERRFATVERFDFANEMRFDSADALVGYWSAYNLYDPALEDRFRAAAAAHFASSDVFVSAKRVVGVRAIKG
jgi:demethylmenaquinone methyltransferase/2-methoxy-6-polyprenyl-1,4-benzoquinol methylase